MAEVNNMAAQNSGSFKEFIATLATMSGDLSNITAPPFLLDTKSTVELPQYWSDHPSIFCAPGQSSDPAERAMLVLRWYLSSLRNQNYMGRGENEGVKKPLNAFLGELFIGRFDGGEFGETKLVIEQVSHHPPITACRVWNETHGVVAEGYTRQSITFGGNVTITQTGHALLKLTKHNETFLVPLPTLKIRGILSGAMYPELGGKVYIPSNNGYTSVIDFSGKGWFSGKKNTFSAKVYRDEDGETKPIYSMQGQWNGKFTIRNEKTGKDIETIDVQSLDVTASKLIVDPLDEQDPWESRRAWDGVISSLRRGDMSGTTKAKSVLEQGQRNMRKDDESQSREWTSTFFHSVPSNEICELLEQKLPGYTPAKAQKLRKDTRGIWVFNDEEYRNGDIQKPYHGELVPDNSQSTNSYSIDARRHSDFYRDSVDLSRRSSVASIYTHDSQRSSLESVPSLVPSSEQSLASPRVSFDSSAQNSPLNSMSSLRGSLDGVRPKNLSPGVVSVRRGSVGSLPPGMELNEKLSVEDYLRDQYSSGKKKEKERRGSRFNREARASRSGLSVETYA